MEIISTLIILLFLGIYIFSRKKDNELVDYSKENEAFFNGNNINGDKPKVNKENKLPTRKKIQKENDMYLLNNNLNHYISGCRTEIKPIDIEEFFNQKLNIPVDFIRLCKNSKNQTELSKMITPNFFDGFTLITNENIHIRSIIEFFFIANDIINNFEYECFLKLWFSQIKNYNSIYYDKNKNNLIPVLANNFEKITGITAIQLIGDKCPKFIQSPTSMEFYSIDFLKTIYNQIVNYENTIKSDYQSDIDRGYELQEIIYIPTYTPALNFVKSKWKGTHFSITGQNKIYPSLNDLIKEGCFFPEMPPYVHFNTGFSDKNLEEI